VAHGRRGGRLTGVRRVRRAEMARGGAGEDHVRTSELGRAGICAEEWPASGAPAAGGGGRR
jgi:hypothetical protein